MNSNVQSDVNSTITENTCEIPCK